MKLLMTPGPVNVPKQVAKKESEPLIHHRKKEFAEILQDVTHKLKKILKTKHDVFVLTSSGTGAMEAAVSNFLSKGDNAIVLKTGYFGERWAEICTAYGVNVLGIDAEWGKNPDYRQIQKQIHGAKAVFTTLVDTSTGALQDIKQIGMMVSGTDAVLVVDAVSGLGGQEINADEWGLDVVCAASQKSLMCAPGLSFISVSPKAWQLAETSNLPKYYFSLKHYKEYMQKGQTPYTPAISLVKSLQAALGMIEKEGFENVLKRHETMAEAVRQSVKALGLEILAESPSNIVTAVKIPDNIGADSLVNIMDEKYDIVISGGQNLLKGKIIRLGHLGNSGKKEILMMISALEKSLAELGHQFEKSAGVKAAKKVFKGE